MDLDIRRFLITAGIVLIVSGMLAAGALMLENVNKISAKASDRSTPSDAAYETAEANWQIRQGDLSLRYEVLTEDQYTEEIWMEFYRLCPGLSNTEGTGLRELVEAMFLPYYSLTTGYAYEDVLGAWEFAMPDEESGGYKSLGIYAYGRELEPDGSPREGEAGEYAWHEFKAPEISLYYPDWVYHRINASMINGNTLRLHIEVSVYDSMQGGNLAVTYQLCPIDQRFSSSALFINPVYSIRSTKESQPDVGTMTYNYFKSRSSDTDDRYLEIDAYWDISGEDLQEFLGDLEGDHLHWTCGSHGSGYSSLYGGTISIANLRAYASQAACTHANKKYTKINNDTTVHSLSCTDCGADLGTEPHNKSGGTCTKCGYKFTVSGKLIYVLNGRTESEGYTKDPGSSFVPKAFTGYKTPSAVTVPADGGDIRISYTPISYILKLGEQTKSLKYDEEYKLPSINKKGHTHEGFYFAS